ncbi:hypothetical protein [Agrococcus sp. GCM10030264]|uniref:hypothetical protein n=1 Tax=Agrococcus sp. GCM10030264 TaxID=3273377 RepID=UPI003614F734
MEKRTWITVGAAGTLGLGLVAVGALATANAMDVDDSTQVAQGGVVLGSGLVEKSGVTVRVTGDHASVVSAPSPTDAPAAPAPTTSAPSAPAAPAPAPAPAPTASAPSAVAAPAPAPAAAPAPAPAPAPTWDSAPSAASPVSPVSAPSGD